MISVNTALDFNSAEAALRANGFAQVPDFLDPASAEALASQLADTNNWDLAITGPQGPVALTASEVSALTPAKQASLTQGLRRQARSGFSFHYLFTTCAATWCPRNGNFATPGPAG